MRSKSYLTLNISLPMKMGIFPSLFLLLIRLHNIFAENHIVCPGVPFENVLVNPKSTPYGYLSAGRYKKVPAVETLSDCVEACCDDNTCNVAFLFNTSCYSIHCRSYKLCKPLKRKGKKFENSFVVIIRNPEEKFMFDDEFSDPVNEGLTFHEDFYSDDTDDVDSKGISQSLFDHSASTTDHFTRVPKPCVFGMGNDCPEYEQCVPKNNRARTGVCSCEDGYNRDSLGHCKRTRASSNKNQHITISPSTESNQALSQKKNKTDKIISTTELPVHRLVVSAGDNVTLQLPENEVTLSAYALRQEEGEGDNYKYEWNLISHPEGDETGTMQDQNTKNLKLSKLRAGLYTFKVTVSSSNAVGEAMVNVTVLPLERANKPPVAIIQPSNVTVKLPNKDTVLDGSCTCKWI